MFSRLNLSNLPFPCITDDSERVDKQAKLTQIGWHKTPIDLDFLTKVSIVLFIKVALEDFPQCPQQYTFIIHGWRHSPKAPSSRVAPVQVSSTIPPPAWAAWGRWCGRHWAERGDCLLSSRNWDFPTTSATSSSLAPVLRCGESHNLDTHTGKSRSEVLSQIMLHLILVFNI